MKTTLLLASLLVTAAQATDTIKVTGLARTDMEAAWGVKAKQGWEGRLDCQSFLHYVTFSSGQRTVTKYLAPDECEEWFSLLRRSHLFRPVCLTATELGVVSCKTPQK
jgi:hypothetical protein